MKNKSINTQPSWEPLSQLAFYLTEPSTAGSIVPKIAAGIAALPDAQYPQLDHYVRTHSSWWKCKPSDVIQTSSLTKSAAAAGILSMHGSGYIRQAAVQELAKFDDGSEIPFLLLRLSDWVPQVRAEACSVVEQRLNQLSHIVQHIVLLRLVQQRPRLKGDSKVEELIALVEKALRSPAAHPFVLSKFRNHTDSTTRRACFKVLIESQIQNKAEAMELALLDRDQSIRLEAVRSISSHLSSDNCLRVIAQCLCDQSPAIRIEALRHLSGLPTGGRCYLESSLTDGAASVRNFARFQMRELGMMTDFADFYKQYLLGANGKSSIAGAVAGLGETGTREDAEKLEQYLAKPQVSVIKNALAALSSLKGDGYIIVFLEHLSHDHPGISNAALKALQAYPASIDDEKLSSMFQQHHQFHVRRNLLRLSNKLEKWSRITTLMDCRANTDDSELAEIIGRLIDSFIGQYRSSWQFTQPSQRQLQKFNSAFLACKLLLKESQAQFFETWKTACPKV